MSKPIRPVLLIAMVVLSVLYFGRPQAEAAPSCTAGGPGHRFDCDPIMGTADSSCTGSGHGEYCAIGQICWEWDCVQNPDGSLSIANVVSYPPTFCFCSPTHFKCC